MKRNWMQKQSVDISLVIQKSQKDIDFTVIHITQIVETGNVRFIENGKTSESEASRNVEIKKIRVQVPLISTSTSKIVVPLVDEPHNDQEEQINDPELTMNL